MFPTYAVTTSLLNEMGAKESYNLVGEGNPTAMIVASTRGRHRPAPDYHL
jgi:hypothetical protein